MQEMYNFKSFWYPKPMIAAQNKGRVQEAGKHHHSMRTTTIFAEATTLYCQ
jgi:hypothetical protein